MLSFKNWLQVCVAVQMGLNFSEFLTIRTRSLELLEVTLQQHLKDPQISTSGNFHCKMEMWLVFVTKLLYGSSSYPSYSLFNVCMLGPTGKSLTLELSSHTKTDASDKQLWSSSQTVMIQFPRSLFLFFFLKKIAQFIYLIYNDFCFNMSKPENIYRK